MPQKTCKVYSLERSPLFDLKNKRTFAELLRSTPKELSRLSTKGNYNDFIEIKNGKRRRIQAPSRELKSIQRSFKKLLARIETPDWLMSGKKNVSYIDNAKVHRDSRFLLTVDISSFYESCQREHVFQMFNRTFKMADDVAWLATDLVTYLNFVPTGAPTSQLIAYWTYSKTFHRINSLADRCGLRFSLYVDDLSFSGAAPIPGQFPYWVHRELSRFGMRVKRRKTKFYDSKDYKFVTGAAISPVGKLVIPNAKRHEVAEMLYGGTDLKAFEGPVLRKMLGKIESMRQIESGYNSKLYERLRALIYSV